MRIVIALSLSLMLALSGAILAGAKGASHDIGMEVVICSGVGMTTITIGPDGEPIETKEVCPDGHSTFGATFALPAPQRPQLRLVAHVSRTPVALLSPRFELVPSARGPPLTV